MTKKKLLEKTRKVEVVVAVCTRGPDGKILTAGACALANQIQGFKKNNIAESPLDLRDSFYTS